MDTKREMQQFPGNPVNYIFFGFYFLAVAIIHVFHVFLIEPVVSFSTYFFSVCALMQSVLETLFLILIGGVIEKYFFRLMNIYIVFVFFMFLSHVIDFPLVRLMDMSFWYALHFISQESYLNFVELLLASNISMMVWILVGISGIFVLLSGIFFYRIAQRWTQKRPWSMSPLALGGVLCAPCVFLLGWDYGLSSCISTLYWDRFEKALPWKSIFFSSGADYLTLKNSLKEPVAQEELLRTLDSRIFSLVHQPDIYLFIIESLREDYITEENSPHLQQFRKKYVSFERTFSNANATQNSWFSLFYSTFPFYWGRLDPGACGGGSASLRLLKKMGYKIYVASSSRLSYYQMNRVIFGEGEYLADSMFYPDEQECDQPYLKDQSVMLHLQKQMMEEGSGRVFVTFLDATHFDYSWPKEMTQFIPYEEKINYFKAAINKRGLEEIINRYRNSLYFIDSQFGTFMEALGKAPGGKEAVVVVTGDHGEEFYEHGNLFHASSLSHPQISPPLYYKFGEDEAIKKKINCKMTCHMDIFPTLFHYLAGEDLMEDVLQGQSIFKTHRWPYTVIARFNASRTPYEYCIHNGEEKLTVAFNNDRDIFASKALKVLSTKNCQDENLSKELDAIGEEFGPAFDRLFPNKVQ